MKISRAPRTVGAARDDGAEPAVPDRTGEVPGECRSGEHGTRCRAQRPRPGAARGRPGRPRPGLRAGRGGDRQDPRGGPPDRLRRGGRPGRPGPGAGCDLHHAGGGRAAGPAAPAGRGGPGRGPGAGPGPDLPLGGAAPAHPLLAVGGRRPAAPQVMESKIGLLAEAARAAAADRRACPSCATPPPRSSGPRSPRCAPEGLPGGQRPGRAGRAVRRRDRMARLYAAL